MHGSIALVSTRIPIIERANMHVLNQPITVLSCEFYGQFYYGMFYVVQSVSLVHEKKRLHVNTCFYSRGKANHYYQLKHV